MVWGIVVVAVIVLALGAWAGAGHLGEMPGPVNDRPKPHIPEGPVDRAFLDRVRIPRVGVGYSPSQVDAYLEGFLSGPPTGEELEQSFDVVRGGYDMQAVDVVLERVADSLRPARRAEDDVPETPATHGSEGPINPRRGPGVPEYGVVGDNRGHDQGISKD